MNSRWIRSRFTNGLMSYYSGAMLLMEPKLIMKYIGHYDIPDNFGHSWYDVVPDPDAFKPALVEWRWSFSGSQHRPELL